MLLPSGGGGRQFQERGGRGRRGGGGGGRGRDQPAGGGGGLREVESGPRAEAKLFENITTSGINFDKYENIPVR